MVRASRLHDSTAIEEVRPGRPHHKTHKEALEHFDNSGRNGRVGDAPMTFFAVMIASTPPTAPPEAENLVRLLFWVAVPAVILATILAAFIKRAILSSPRFRDRRPNWRTFAWVAVSDMVAWAVLWPALLAVRIHGIGGGRGIWIIALLLVVALGYTGNRYGFGRAFDPAIAGSLRGTLLAELFTILMPVLAVIFGVLIFWLIAALGV